MVTAAGSGSGIDIESIVNQLMSLERRPLQVLAQKRQRLDVELSDSGKLQSQLESLSTVAETLADASRFGAWESTSTDDEVLTASNIDGLVEETHAIEVTALASAHRIISDPLETELSEFGTGTIDFSAGDESFSVTLTAQDNTLSDLQDAINSAGDNTIVNASIINTDAGSRLILTASKEGVDNEVTIDDSAFSSSTTFDTLNEASDAELTIDGLAITSSTNKLNETVAGLSIELKAVGSANITSTQNTESITETLDEFATSYNDLLTTMNRLSEGSFQGDGITRRIESRLREQFFESVESADGESVGVFEFGFTFDRTGTLSVDKDVLTEIVTQSPSFLVKAFTQEDTGFADRIQNVLTSFTDTGGFFDSRSETIEARQSTIDRQLERLESRMESVEMRFRRQFTAMDTTVSQLQSSSNYLFGALTPSS